MTSHVTPYLCAKGAADAITFYQEAFGATESYRLANATAQSATPSSSSVIRPSTSRTKLRSLACFRLPR